MNPYVGEIRMWGGFRHAPAGWAFCDGSPVSRTDNDMLFMLIGTTYGSGDGVNTFNLPDLRGRVPIHMGTQGGETFPIGSKGGSETVTLTTDQIPSHTHVLTATDSKQITRPSTFAFPASVTPTKDFLYGPPGGSPATFVASTIGNTGGGQAHNNIQPYVAINFIICLFGNLATHI
jgi:microcystin-dependent protein